MKLVPATKSFDVIVAFRSALAGCVMNRKWFCDAPLAIGIASTEIVSMTATAHSTAVIRRFAYLHRIHPLVVAAYFREVRRTPDQNGNHPPFGL